MLAYIPYMDPMGHGIDLETRPEFRHFQSIYRHGSKKFNIACTREP